MEILRHTSSDQVVRETKKEIKTSTSQPSLDLQDMFQILQIDPNDSLIALELARRLRNLGRVEESYRILINVLKIDSRFATLNALAQVEYQLDRTDDAFAHLQQAVLVAPEYAPELFDVFKTLGNIFTRKGDLDSAEDSYNKAHRLNPTSDTLYVNLGTLSVQRKRWDEAVERFRHALSLNPANDKAWVGLALGHRMKGDVELAWGNIEAALEYNPLNEVALGLALDWSTQNGREFRALELIRIFLIAGGWSERLSLAFVWLSFLLVETSRARLELERLLAVNPQNIQALNMLHEMRSLA